MQNNLEFYNQTKDPAIDWNFLYDVLQKIKLEILTKKFILSLSILSPKSALKVNKKSRGKNYTPNTLSFKYSINSGEIILTPKVIVNETYNIQELEIKSLMNKIIYLFIHSCLHLKDHDHGDKMTNLEKKYYKKYKLP